MSAYRRLDMCDLEAWVQEPSVTVLCPRAPTRASGGESASPLPERGMPPRFDPTDSVSAQSLRREFQALQGQASCFANAEARLGVAFPR